MADKGKVKVDFSGLIGLIGAIEPKSRGPRVGAGVLVPIGNLVGEVIEITDLEPRFRYKGKPEEKITGYTAIVNVNGTSGVRVKLTEMLEEAMCAAFDAKPDATFEVRVVSEGKHGRGERYTFAAK